ncbi:MAG: autotransporter domain-containing protein [Methyloligellaceae bacterium]
MRNLVKLCCKGVILAAIGLGPSIAYADSFKVNRIFMLGDSLSDGGAYSNIAKAGINQAFQNAGINAEAPDLFYKFTQNNPTKGGPAELWIDVVAEQFGITLKPNVINGITIPVDHDSNDTTPPIRVEVVAPIEEGGTNYAQGGARINDRSFISANSDPNDPEQKHDVTALPVVMQIDRLLDDVGGKFHKNDLITLFIGGNDIFAYQALMGNSTITRQEAEGAIVQQLSILETKLQDLKKAGARNIIFFTLPEGSTPGGQEPSLSTFFNNTFLEQRNGKDGIVVDFTRLIDAISLSPENAQRYGYAPNLFSNRACLGDGASDSLACINIPSNLNDGGPYFLADAVHLSRQTNKNFGDLVLSVLKAGSQSANITTTTLSTLRQHGLSLETRLTPDAYQKIDKKGRLVSRKKGSFDAFASLEGGYFESDGGQIDPGSNSRTQNLLIGGDVMVSDKALVGMSVSFNRAENDYEDKSGGYDSLSIVGSLYANASLSKSTYVNAVVGLGHIDLDDITRKFNIGPSKEQYSGDTTGDYKMARIGGGFILPHNGWTINPALAYTYENLKIKGYSENVGAGSLAFGDNEIESSRLTASLTVSYNSKDPYDWKPMVRVSLEHEFKDDDLRVHLGPNENSIGTLYLDRPDGTYGYLTGGLSKKISDSTTFGINATTVIGQDGVTGVSGGVSLKSKF